MVVGLLALGVLIVHTFRVRIPSVRSPEGRTK